MATFAVSLPHVALELLSLCALTCLVVFILSAVIQSRTLLILSGIIITEMLVLLWQYVTMIQSKNKYAAEGYWYPIALLFFTAPIVAVISSLLVTLVVRRNRKPPK